MTAGGFCISKIRSLPRQWLMRPGGISPGQCALSNGASWYSLSPYVRFTGSIPAGTILLPETFRPKEETVADASESWWDGLEIIDIPSGHPLHPGDVCEWWVPVEDACGAPDVDFCMAPVSGRKCGAGHRQVASVVAANFQELGELS